MLSKDPDGNKVCDAFDLGMSLVFLIALIAIIVASCYNAFPQSFRVKAVGCKGSVSYSNVVSLPKNAVVIYDITGRQVSSSNDVKHLQKGFYIVVFSNKKRKLIIS